MTLVEHRLRVPLRVPLGGRSSRDVVLVGGPAGWGECSPLPGYPADPDRCRAAAEEAATLGWPPAVRDAVPVNGVVPAVGADVAARLAAEWLESQGTGGPVTVKVKVGDEGDLDRVAAVRAALGPGHRLRVDANGAWDPETARRRIGLMAAYDLELVEQPVATLEELARLRRVVAVPLAADECVRSMLDARRLAALGAADVVVLKVQAFGGVRPALGVAAAAGLPVVVTSMFETSVGLAAGVALAAALPELDYACGLGSASLLATDVVAEPLVPSEGRLKSRQVVPDPVLLAELALDRSAEGRG